MYDSAVWFSRLELVSPLGNGALSLFSPPDSYGNRKAEAVGSFRSKQPLQQGNAACNTRKKCIFTNTIQELSSISLALQEYDLCILKSMRRG